MNIDSKFFEEIFTIHTYVLSTKTPFEILVVEKVAHAASINSQVAQPSNIKWLPFIEAFIYERCQPGDAHDHKTIANSELELSLQDSNYPGYTHPHTR